MGLLKTESILQPETSTRILISQCNLTYILNSMIFPSSQSFTPLATLDLSSPHVLHPEACNPAMDLVVLIAENASSSSSASGYGGGKGKGKAALGSGASRVSLWRMTGSKVWDIGIEGRIAGLAWSRDGEYQTFLADVRVTVIHTRLLRNYSGRALRYSRPHTSPFRA
jgi:hypothetical protein